MYDLVLKPESPVFLAPGALRQEVRERGDDGIDDGLAAHIDAAARNAR